MKGTLYTTYFNSKKSEGYKVAIVRYKPKWLDFGKEKIFHIPALAPSEEILNEYNKHKDTDSVAWDRFSAKFRDQIRRDVHLKDAIKCLTGWLDKGEDITLICYEKDAERCHRSILAEEFSLLGYDTKEL